MDSRRIRPWFLTLSDIAEFVYKTNNYYSLNHERGVIWNDEEINIAWPSQSERRFCHRKILIYHHLDLFKCLASSVIFTLHIVIIFML